MSVGEQGVSQTGCDYVPLRFFWHGTWFANHAQKQDNEDGEESHLQS